MAFDLRRLLGLDVETAHPQHHTQVRPVNHPYNAPGTVYEDGSSQPNLQVHSNMHAANLGVPYSQAPDSGLAQGGTYNAGFTPLQGSFGAGAFQQQTGNPFQPQFNPQDSKRQQYWLQ